jgi:indole-3-glycerol phosphate synthase
MVHAVPDILARIVEQKRADLPRLSAGRKELEHLASARTDRRDFRAALCSKQPAIIAEIKKASPSKGVLSHDFDPPRTAGAYEAGGAAAISVLTDEEFFKGSLRDLENARSAVAIPVLRKDFTIDELHVIEAAAHGADAILLIAALLSADEMRDFRTLAGQYGMAALVEVHENAELDAALASGAEIIGVNNRNLHTFEVKLETSIQLARRIPDGILKVAESGIHSRADIETLIAAGFQAFLVGEHLMKSSDPRAALEALLS